MNSFLKVLLSVVLILLIAVLALVLLKYFGFELVKTDSDGSYNKDTSDVRLVKGVGTFVEDSSNSSSSAEEAEKKVTQREIAHDILDIFIDASDLVTNK